MNVYLNFSRELTAPEADALRGMIQRRGQREPLQYITGSVSFCGLELTVNKSVLIPRPETELLAERAWKYLGSLPDHPAPRVLDLCCGSGCLAIALAARVPAALVTATDISDEALKVAQENIARHRLEERVELRQGDGVGALDSQVKFDLIVSNPPYIPSAEIEGLDPEVRDFEPRAALDGGPDGADFQRRIARETGPFLQPEGRVMVELEEESAEIARRIFAEAGWTVEGVEPDLNGKSRILIARRA
jgi:release factor glutamine methyltransferase